MPPCCSCSPWGRAGSQGSHWKTRTTVPSIYQFHKEPATSFGHLHAPANLAPLPNMTSPYAVKNASFSSLTAKFKKPHPCVKHDITKFCIIYEQLYITPAWPPGLLSNLNFHLTQLGHLILQCLWLSYIVLQKVNLEMETEGLNCVRYETKINLWRPKEVTVWYQPLPCAGILGSFRNVRKLHVHAQLILLFVPRSVSPWPVTSQILGHKSQCYFITECCHAEDKTHYSPCFAVSPFSPSSLSHAIHWSHSFHLPSSRCPPAMILHAHGCRSQGRLNAIHPVGAADDHPIGKPMGGPPGIGRPSTYGEQQYRCCNAVM